MLLFAYRCDRAQQVQAEIVFLQAEAGTYTVSLNDEVRIRDKACAFLVNAVTKRPVDYSLFSVQVYRHTSGMVLSLCILGIIFGAVIMVSGAILPAVL